MTTQCIYGSYAPRKIQMEPKVLLKLEHRSWQDALGKNLWCYIVPLLTVQFLFKKTIGSGCLVQKLTMCQLCISCILKKCFQIVSSAWFQCKYVPLSTKIILH